MDMRQRDMGIGHDVHAYPAPAKSLYQIREEHLILLQQIEDAEGELTPEMEQSLCLTEEDFQSKAISYSYVIKGFNDTGDVIEKEISRLKKLQERAEKTREQFKARLAEAMIQFGVEKIESPVMKISFRKSEGVEITDETAIPSEFFDVKTVSTISKTRIKEIIKAGEVVPGAEFVTRKNLQIK